jgi:hypothetical protein
MVNIQKSLYSKKPLLFIAINFILIALTRVVTTNVFGYTPTGYFWIFILLYGVFTIFTNNKITFPVLGYLPFTIYLIGYLIYDYSFLGLQSTLQYLVPLLTGMAFSGFVINDYSIQKIFRYNRYFVYLILFYVLIYPFFSGIAPHNLGLAAIVMTCCISGILLLGEYFTFKIKYSLLLFLLLVLVPIIAVTRMGVLTILLILPLNLFKVNIRFRLLCSIVIILGGLFIFNLPNFQTKMFHSGKGTIKDISLENEDFSTSGRKTLYDLLEYGIEQNPVWGNGPRSELGLFIGAGLTIKESHNDYLTMRYEYGWVGLILLLFAYAIQIINLLRKLKKESNIFIRVMIQASLTMFIPYFAFMYTDNILKYTFFYGTLHFAIIAIAYSTYIPSKSGESGSISKSRYNDVPYSITN